MPKQKINNYRIIEESGKQYIFISQTSSLFEISDEVRNMIDEDKQLFIYNETVYDKQIVEQLDKAGFFVESFEKTKIKLERNDLKPTALVLMLSQDCNLRCKYCYAGDGKYHNKGFMKEDIAKRAIDYAFENFETDNISIILFGGEPLLNQSIFEFCVKYSNKKAIESNKRVNFSITTNGTLLNKENAKIIIDNNFNVTLSIDGDSKTHDKNRFYMDKRGSYDDAVNNVREYLGVHNISARATLTKHNPNIKEIFEHLHGLGFRTVHISPSIEFMDKNAYDRLIESYREMIEEFNKRLKNKDYRYCLGMTNIVSYLDRINRGGVRGKFCGAYNNMIVVDIEGSFYGCHRLVAAQETKYGNIFKENIIDEKIKKEVINKLVNRGNSDCNKCWISSLCGGGCPAENYYFNTDFTIPNELTCYYLKSIMIYLIKLYLSLSEEEKEVLFNNRKIRD